MSVFKNATIAMADVLGSRNYIKNAGKDPKTDAERHYAEMLHNLMADAVSLFEDSEDISLKAFSDNFIIYSEDNSPNTAKRIVQGMAGLQYNAICKYGLLLRGGITEGKMYWSEDGAYDDFVTGKALLRAHELESEIAVYPRIIVDGPVADKIDAGGLVVRNENIFFINRSRRQNNMRTDNHTGQYISQYYRLFQFFKNDSYYSGTNQNKSQIRNQSWQAVHNKTSEILWL